MIPLGLSAQAIAGHSNDHPWDPADLRRCVEYCRYRGITTPELQKRMAGRSETWDRLLPEWDRLTSLLDHEMETRSDNRAPLTYIEMKIIRADGIKCEDCSGSGRGVECAKCKGTGKRNGGKCRADYCFEGAHFCSTCRGNGYTKKAN